MRFNWFGLIVSIISLTQGSIRECLYYFLTIFSALPMDMNELNFQPYPNGLQKRISKTVLNGIMIALKNYFRFKHSFGHSK